MRNNLLKVSSLVLLLLTPLYLFSQDEELLNTPPPLDTLHFPVCPGCYDPALSEQKMLRCTREYLTTLIYANLEWPAEKLADSGYVKIRIHVNANGTLYDFEVIEGLNPFVDFAVLSACNKIILKENWRPAYIYGQPLDTEFVAWVKYNPHVAEDNVVRLGQLGKSVYRRIPIIFFVEQMPSFPGESNALWKFILDNLELPPLDSLSFQGSQVVVQFVVERDGSITNAKIMKSIHPDIDAAYLKLFSKMPNWIPGRQRGMPARMVMNLPIRVRLE
jgi:hypothetical protein